MMARDRIKPNASSKGESWVGVCGLAGLSPAVDTWLGPIDADINSPESSSRGESKIASGSPVESSMIEKNPAGLVLLCSADESCSGSKA